MHNFFSVLCQGQGRCVKVNIKDVSMSNPKITIYSSGLTDFIRVFDVSILLDYLHILAVSRQGQGRCVQGQGRFNVKYLITTR